MFLKMNMSCIAISIFWKKNTNQLLRGVWTLAGYLCKGNLQLMQLNICLPNLAFDGTTQSFKWLY